MARILLVEDDPMLCKEYARYLRSPDGGAYTMDEAKSATSAVQLVQQNQYDLILLDIMMAYAEEDQRNEEIDDVEVDYGRKMGLYVYRKVRELPHPPPIALVSVVDDYGTLSEFQEVAAYLPKYFELDKLKQLVKKCVG